jgi:hypothetical protein
LLSRTELKRPPLQRKTIYENAHPKGRTVREGLNDQMARSVVGGYGQSGASLVLAELERVAGEHEEAKGPLYAALGLHLHTELTAWAIPGDGDVVAVLR